MSSGLVRVMRVRPDGGAIYIGGSFTAVESLSCNGLCALDTTTMQWSLVGQSNFVSGQVYDLSVTSDQVTALGLLSMNNTQSGHFAELRKTTPGH